MASAARFDPVACPRLVVKIGSSLLIEAGAVRRAWLASVVADLAARRAAGQQIVVVSSGAIALGARRLGLEKGGRASLEDAQAAAAVGQVALSAVWEALLSAAGLTMAQVLLTLGDLEDRRRYLNVAATIDRLLALGAVPVLNENDTVATTEIRFGDNDRLAARAAQAAGASGVILLSDVDGLYTANPARDASASLIPIVDRITPEIAAMADGGSGSGLGTGGMAAKIAAARIAAAAGIPLAIADGRIANPLARFAATGHGTVFVAGEGARARKAWLAGRLTVAGTLTIDAGAAAALARGKSLLAAGVTQVAGNFARGDVVAITGPDGTIAHGLAGYDAADADAIKGLRGDVQAAVLGYAPRAAIVHADHLVLL
ncbi:glutamate 5-kinase [Polymorphobacter fuscus]|uniref:Glutamate 5-kinase n=1 Tax=Sandarakinorhabdus fusca TaxID=1439888 RepID=A0A7C9KY59_9SPHN|nr:glutamate 5-kinase [Polymorphobacter fuscus]KAB7645629.1 glutamate 5-kinase [Polymorphobacter fuscus]MQT17886.1 glutamate 5-kinase [Polymorphobacter fuscus]